MDIANNDATRPNNHGHTIWDQISVVDSTVNGTAPTAPGATVFMGGDHMYFAGNSLDEGGTAQLNVATHVTRFWYLAKAVINNNTLQRAGPGLATIKLHGPTWCESSISSLNPALPLCNYSTDAPSPLLVTTYGVGEGITRWVVLSDNKYIAAYNPGQVYIQPQNVSRYEILRDIITERNLYVAGANTFPTGLNIDGSDITVRNEIFYSGSNTSNMTGIWVFKEGISPASNRVSVYNNSFYNGYSGTTSNAPAVRIDSTSSNIAVKNNIYYAPSAPITTHTINCDHYSTLGGGAAVCEALVNFVQSNNSTDTSLGGQVKISPFIMPLPVNPIDFTPSAGYAANSGTQVPVFSDFFKTLRPQGAGYDMGAVERQ